jgi:hypothetical protein
MKKRIAILLSSAALLLIPSLASAAEPVRAYDNGPVWDVSAVQTKPGHFDDYMKYVATTWRALNEELKKQGQVLDYKVLTVADPRDNEPDLYLLVEWKNMAAFDAPLDKQDALTRKVFGSVSDANKAGMDRESIRTLRGDMLTRELILK